MRLKLKLRLHGRDVKEITLESGREYTFGRSSSCDVQLEEQPGISRQHFTVSEVDGEWTAKVIAKFGDLVHAGSPVSTLKLESGTVFKLGGYDFAFIEAIEEQESVVVSDEQNEILPMASGDMTGNLPAKYNGGGDSFAGDDDATRIISTPSTGDLYLRIVDGENRQNSIKLDSKKSIAGRDESCTISLADRKASRRQFEITSTAQGVFIRDLGSSNGTILNGMPLAADELKILRSGDVIQVGQLTIHFEVRDPSFEKRLMVVPPEILAAPPVPNQPQYEMINYPMPSGPGGAVRVLENEQVDDEAANAAKKKKMRFYLIAAIIFIPIIGMLMNSDPKESTKKDATSALSPAAEAFAKLSPQKQQQVKETYILSKNLYIQGKQVLAAEQLKKLHEILPEGYENSLAIAEECRQIAEQAEAQRLAQLALKEAETNRRIVDENIRKCEPMANSTFDVNQLKQCLAPTYERDPGNPRISEFVSRVEIRVDARNQKAEMQRDFAQRVARGKKLHQEAMTLDQKGDAFAAMAAYRRHLSAGLPDPDDLKPVSTRNLAAIEQNIGADIEKALAAAETAFANGNYKEAIVQVKRAKSLDPKSDRAAELNAKISRDLNVKLRELYEEGVIYEGLGQIDVAKTNWKKILEIDHPEGEYYKKARSKLRAYGGQ